MALSAQVMPNPREMSGKVLPVSDVPAGTVIVRVIRGSFDRNVTGHPVEFTIGNEKRTVNTDASGRAQVSGLKPGARVQASTVVDGERIESEVAEIAATGFRIMLVAIDRKAAGPAGAGADTAPAGAAPAAPAPSVPAIKGNVTLGPASRIIVEFSSERLNVYYALEIVNAESAPVDLGGPLVVELPRDARGASVLQGSSQQATANGPRITVTGPFLPGSTAVQIGYELPFSGPAARLRQVWPATLSRVSLYLLQFDQVDMSSPQFASKQQATEQGQPIIFGTGPAIPAGQSLDVNITGLPHHPRWPRNLALGLAAVIICAGVWAAVFTTPRRRARTDTIVTPSAPPGFDAVDVRDVSKSYGRRRALSRVTLTFRAGEIVGLLGPNGAGKSTLLGIVSTLVSATSGEVRYGPETARDGGDALRAHIGVLGHELFVYGDLTVAENLQFFGRLHGVADLERRVAAALGHAGLEPRAGDRVSRLSRGLRQRLALERALIHEPTLVLLDEPFTGLDDESAGVLAARLRALRDRGAIVVMATHDFDAADGLIDRAVCLRQGRARAIDAGPGSLVERYRRALAAEVEEGAR